MQVIKVELPFFEYIEVIPIGDTHIGEEHTDEQYIKDVIKYVTEKPYRFVILNGDLMNVALKDSVSDIYTEKYSPSQQLIRVANMFKPIADRILAMGTGNHEDRVKLRTDIDLSYWLAKEMGIEHRYADNSFVLFVKFGRSVSARPTNDKKNVYSFYVWHGAGGGRKSGGKVNRVMDMSNTVNADVYIMNHVHDVMVKPAIFFDDDCQNMSIKPRERMFIIGNCWQDFGGYGQKFGFKPASKDIASVILNGNGQKKMKLITGNNKF